MNDLVCVYIVVLNGTGASFRGYLVQARTVADESPVGSYIASDVGQRLSSCPIPEVNTNHFALLLLLVSIVHLSVCSDSQHR